MLSPYYSHAGIDIYHADCRDVLDQLPRFDLLLCDPPYGIGASGGTGKYGVRKFASADLKWDTCADSALVGKTVESCSHSVVWGGNYFVLPPSRQFWVWDKGAGFRNRSFAEAELAWCSWDGNAKVFCHDPLANGDYHKGQKQHPTQKPLALMKWCITQAPADVRSVLDPFMGSGTTLVAAKAFGLRAVGIEAEEAYCEIAAKRLAQEQMFDYTSPDPSTAAANASLPTSARD